MTVERPALNVRKHVREDHVIEKVDDPKKLLIVYKSTPPPKEKRIEEKFVMVKKTEPKIEIDQIWRDETGILASHECYEIVKDEHGELLNYARGVDSGSYLAFFIDDVRRKGYPCIERDMMWVPDSPEPIIERLLYAVEPTYALYTDARKDDVAELGIFKTAIYGYITIRYSQVKEVYELRLYDVDDRLVEVAYVKPEDARPIIEKLMHIAEEMYSEEEE